MHKDQNVKIILGGEKEKDNGLTKGRNKLVYLRTNQKTDVATGELTRQRKTGMTLKNQEGSRVLGPSNYS